MASNFLTKLKVSAKVEPMTQTADTATEELWHICALVKSADGSTEFPLEQDAPNEQIARKMAKASSLFDGRAHIHSSTGVIANYVNGEEVE